MGDLWTIGDIETDQMHNPADEFNWPGDFGVFPAFTDPFMQGTTPTNEFPWNSNFVKSYATDFDVQFDYAGSDATALLTLSWSPSTSGTETKEVFVDGVSVGTVTRMGATAAGWWSSMQRFQDTFSFALTTGSHTITLKQLNGDGTLWDYVKLEIIDCSASCGSSSSEDSSFSSESSSFSSSSSDSSESSSFSSHSSSSSSPSGGGLHTDGATRKAGVPGTGNHRGSMTNTIASSLNVSFALANGSRPGNGLALAPGGFGGGPGIFNVSDLPPAGFGGGPLFFSENQKILLCKAQKILKQHVDRLPARGWVASMLASVLNLSKPAIFEALDDPNLCTGLNLSRASDYGTY